VAEHEPPMLTLDPAPDRDSLVSFLPELATQAA
jgi:hypothetical protein